MVEVTPIPEDRRSVQDARRRSRILVAASQCFAERGFKATTLDEIAWAADVSKPHIYKHFDGKEALVGAVLSNVMESWIEGSRQAAAVDAPAGERIARSLRASLEFARAHPILATFFRQDRQALVAGHRDTLARAGAESRQRVAEILRAGIADGQLRADLDLEASAEAIELLHVSMVETALGVRVRGGLPPNVVDAALGLLLHGIAKPESTQ